MVELRSVSEVFEELGGIVGVAYLTGATYRAAHNWKAAGQFPPKTYMVLTAALKDAGCTAPSNLWGFVAAQ